MNDACTTLAWCSIEVTMMALVALSHRAHRVAPWAAPGRGSPPPRSGSSRPSLLWHFARIRPDGTGMSERPKPDRAQLPSILFSRSRQCLQPWADRRRNWGIAISAGFASGFSGVPSSRTGCVPCGCGVVRRCSKNIVRSIRAWGIFLWLGAVIGLFRLLLGLWGAATCRRWSNPVNDPDLLSLVATFRHAIGCHRTIEIRERRDCAAVTAAAVGWRRPVVLLPGDWRSWTATELRAVIGHELAHVVARGLRGGGHRATEPRASFLSPSASLDLLAIAPATRAGRRRAWRPAVRRKPQLPPGSFSLGIAAGREFLGVAGPDVLAGARSTNQED